MSYDKSLWKKKLLLLTYITCPVEYMLVPLYNKFLWENNYSNYWQKVLQDIYVCICIYLCKKLILYIIPKGLGKNFYKILRYGGKNEFSIKTTSSQIILCRRYLLGFFFFFFSKSYRTFYAFVFFKKYISRKL